MSETDDRMERAERIRRMRESREPTEGDSSKEDAAEDDTDMEDAAEDETGNGNAAEGDVDDEAPVTAGTESAGVSDTSDVAASDVDPSSNGASEETAQDDANEAVDVATTEAAVSVAEAATNAGRETPPAAGIAPLGDSTGFSLPGKEDAEATADDAAGEGNDDTAGGAARARGSVAATTEPSVRVLEFTVGEQVYCIDIERVEEIVKRETVTRVPNTDDYVEGVVDLRGQITTILDTKRLLGADEAGRESLLVIFAPDAFEEHGTVGWVVDEVRQVVPVMDSQIRTPPSEDEHVRGIVDRDETDELIVWIEPGAAMSKAVDAVAVE